MAQPRTTPGPRPRVRFEDAITRPTIPNSMILTKQGLTPGTTVQEPLGPVAVAFQGEARVCHDVVTPNFRTLVNKGVVVNNPYDSVKVTCTQGGIGQLARPNSVPDNAHWSPGFIIMNDVQSILRKDERFLFGSPFGSDGSHNVHATVVDVARLQRRAHTAALAAVDTGSATCMVTLGEMGETLATLAKPFDAMKTWLAKNYKLVNRLRKGLPAGVPFTGLPKALADDFLQFYFGMKPMVQDAESIWDALVQMDITPPRQTARGRGSDTGESSTSWSSKPLVEGRSTYDVLRTRKEEVTVRAGIMYVPTLNTAVKQLGLRWSDLPSSAWELVPWSFFIDYFANFGKLISALSPRPGVSYLASWSVTKLTITDEARCLGGGAGGWTWVRPNSEWSRRVIEMTSRSPVSPYAYIGPSFSFGNWDSQLKRVATLCLAIQAVTKR